jgi:hypothetical protein
LVFATSAVLATADNRRALLQAALLKGVRFEKSPRCGRGAARSKAGALLIIKRQRGVSGKFVLDTQAEYC